MSADPSKRPIFVKKVSHHDDEHGGQWKIAYADFVTAMMAFFLIMWLLSSTTSAQRDGIAKYFNSSSILQVSAGDGMLDGGKSIMDGADTKAEKLTESREDGGVQSQQQSNADFDADPMSLFKDKVERQRFEAMKAEFERLTAQGELKEVAKNLQIEMTPEGLRIQIFDRDGEPMFAPGAAEPTPRLARILGVIGRLLAPVRNGVIIAGHTDGQPWQRGAYGNWELSTDRANASRRQLEANGVASDRMVRVEGRASADLLLPQAPADPRNRRIAVTLLRSDVTAQMRGAGRPASGTRP